ncbi:hypothetical protein TOPH_04304, partial [Tolypocladium ophioglossoides CBS 100239]
ETPALCQPHHHPRQLDVSPQLVRHKACRQKRFDTSQTSRNGPHCETWHMDSSLHEVWQAAAGSPFLPLVGKGTQFPVGFVLLLIGLVATCVFALNRSLVNLAVIGFPVSVAVAYVPPGVGVETPS